MTTYDEQPAPTGEHLSDEEYEAALWDDEDYWDNDFDDAFADDIDADWDELLSPLGSLLDIDTDGLGLYDEAPVCMLEDCGTELDSDRLYCDDECAAEAEATARQDIGGRPGSFAVNKQIVGGYALVCYQCGETIDPEDRNQRFCGDTCRQQHYRKQQTRPIRRCQRAGCSNRLGPNPAQKTCSSACRKALSREI